MRKPLAISILLIAFFGEGSGGSMVLRGDAVWKGEVVLGSNLIIPSGVTLRIAPGSVVKFVPKDERLKILVLGKLIARGGNRGRISFTSASTKPQMGDWWGIEFRASDSGSVLENCLIEWGNYGAYCLASSPLLKNDNFSHNLRCGISCINRSSPLVEGCQIWGNGEVGIICKYLSRPVVKGCQVRENPYGIVILDQSCPFLGSSREGGGNLISDNLKYDIYNLSSLKIQAKGNSWKGEQPSQIDKRIYDDEEDANSGEVDFVSLALSPDSVDGPAEVVEKEPDPVAVGILDSLPRVLEQPPAPVDGRCKGEVIIKAWVDEEGKVTETAMISSNLDEECAGIALEFVRGWRFSPGCYQGRRVRFWTTIPVEFSGRER